MASDNDVYNFLLTAATEQDLQDAEAVIKLRRKQLGEQLKVGDRVRLTAIKPKYLAGLTGSITALDTETQRVMATITLDTAMVSPARFRGQTTIPRVPVVCLRKYTD